MFYLYNRIIKSKTLFLLCFYRAMPPRLRGSRGCGENYGHVTRITDISQPHRNLPDHPEGMDDFSFSGGEYMDSTSGNVVSRAYLATPPVSPDL